MTQMPSARRNRDDGMSVYLQESAGLTKGLARSA
jgi:hypothetical protein